MPDGTHRHRVLVVDDESLIRWSLAEILADCGFAVEQASNGTEALDVVAASGGRFDVVLLDFRLPDSNDLQLLARFRELMPHAAVILMTAYSSPEIKQGALDLGAVRVVSKPFELGDMTRFVKQAC